MKFNRRTAVMAVAAMFLVGGASAGVVNYFATSTGSGTITEAVSVTGDLDVQFDNAGDATAPETYSNVIDISNNNADDAVDYKWQVSKSEANSNLGDGDYINTGVYEIQSFSRTVDFENADSKDVSVEVTPSIDTVTYDVSLPYEMNENDDHLFDLEVANGGTTDYHVKYRPSKDFSEGSNEYGVKVYEDGSYTMKTVDEVDAVESVSVSSNSDGEGETVTVVVENPGQDQQFGLRGDYNKGDDSGITSTSEFRIPEDFTYNTVDTFTEAVNTDLAATGEVVNLEGDETENYNFVTEFTEQTGTGDYTVKAQAEP